MVCLCVCILHQNCPFSVISHVHMDKSKVCFSSRTAVRLLLQKSGMISSVAVLPQSLHTWGIIWEWVCNSAILHKRNHVDSLKNRSLSSCVLKAFAQMSGGNSRFNCVTLGEQLKFFLLSAFTEWNSSLLQPSRQPILWKICRKFSPHLYHAEWASIVCMGEYTSGAN